MQHGVARVGVFGGTFDPIHAGHVAAAVGVRTALSLERVLLVVANMPWQKVGGERQLPVTPAADRYAMVAATAEELEGIEASRIEIDRGGASYTVDTVAELAELYPGADLFVVVGADVAASLGTWERADELKKTARLVVVDRPGAAFAAPVAGRDGFEGPDLVKSLVRDGWCARRVAIPLVEVSSTELRARLATGDDVGALVPAPAIRIIQSRGLYAECR
ncbi:MAG: nicotinate-nucleotide adenylyltransferase [Actinomycetota bacterium]|nr:nicotinate-nucleotide adenylyltransferase [Actinomycetota bacterium]